MDQKEAIRIAKEKYAKPSNDDIEIDDRPRVSKVEDDGQLKGYWVQAWVWVEVERK